MVPPWMQGQFPGAGGFNPGNMGNFQPPTVPGGSFPGGFNPIQGHIGGGGPSQTNPNLGQPLDPNRPMPTGPGQGVMPTWNGPGGPGGGGGMRPMPGGPSTAPGGGMGIPPQQPTASNWQTGAPGAGAGGGSFGPQVQQQPGRPRWMDEQQLGSMMDVPWLKDIAMQQGPEMAQHQAQQYAQQNPNSPLGRYMAQQGANKPGMSAPGPNMGGNVNYPGAMPGMSVGPSMGVGWGDGAGMAERMGYQRPGSGGKPPMNPANMPNLSNWQTPAGSRPGGATGFGQPPGPGPQAPGMGPRGQQTGRPPQQQMPQGPGPRPMRPPVAAGPTNDLPGAPQGPGPRPMGPNTRPHTGIGPGGVGASPGMEQGPVQTPNEGRPAFAAVATKPGMTQSPPFNPNGNMKPKPGGTPPIYGGDKPAGGMTETAPVNPGGEMREMQKKLAMQRNQGMKTRAAQKR